MEDIKNRFLCMLPEHAMRLSIHEVLAAVHALADENRLRQALDPHASLPGPFQDRPNSDWLKTANTVGINVRTIGSFWKIIPYTLTLPDAQNAIHILPVWEPGVVASLYGPASWQINPEFYSPELAAAFPRLSNVEAQLKVTVNLLHLLGKAVGMDVVPHTDRYSEMALANPTLFEWLQRRDLEIVRHDSAVFETAETAIFRLLQQIGPAIQPFSLPDNQVSFFKEWTEEERLLALFGHPEDHAGRLRRRKLFVQMLYDLGLETVPATMGPPYRGLEVDPHTDAKVVDEEGRVWRDYRIREPQPMSRVFGPLARYKLYESKNDNKDWALDFSKPHHPAWSYVCSHYQKIQSQYGFDFMRGDMSHVQMRPEGVPEQPDAWYDLHRAVKEHIGQEKPYFGYFAESFLAGPDEMAYGDECAHLEASLADSTLGNLQSEPMGTPEFLHNFYWYRQWLETRNFAPNFTIMTADKDDPRFDSFYLFGNELRHFLGLYLTDMPSYTALGFECRDAHVQPAPNEFYTKLYVFHMPDGPKGTKGPWHWGQNQPLYQRLCRQKLLAQKIWPEIRDQKIRWVLSPDAAGHNKIFAWRSGRFLFMANMSQNTHRKIILPGLEPGAWLPCFSTHNEAFNEQFTSEDQQAVLETIGPWEGLVFESSMD